MEVRLHAARGARLEARGDRASVEGSAASSGLRWRSPAALGFVLESSERNGVDPRLILAVIRAESNFDPGARSSSGARGLMQLMPGTAKRFGAKSIGDPAQNIEAGTRYLRYLLELFKGDVDRTLGAYIAGEMAVVRSGGVPPTKGVQAYVRKVRNYAFEF